MNTKEHMHQLIDELSEDDLTVLSEHLARLHATTDPVERSLLLAALREPEPLSPDDAAAIDEALTEDDEVSHNEARNLLLGPS